MEERIFKFEIGEQVDSNYGPCIVLQRRKNEFMDVNMYYVKYLNNDHIKDTYPEVDLRKRKENEKEF